MLSRPFGLGRFLGDVTSHDGVEFCAYIQGNEGEDAKMLIDEFYIVTKDVVSVYLKYSRTEYKKLRVFRRYKRCTRTGFSDIGKTCARTGLNVGRDIGQSSTLTALRVNIGNRCAKTAFTNIGKT